MWFFHIYLHLEWKVCHIYTVINLQDHQLKWSWVAMKSHHTYPLKINVIKIKRNAVSLQSDQIEYISQKICTQYSFTSTPKPHTKHVVDTAWRKVLRAPCMCLLMVDYWQEQNYLVYLWAIWSRVFTNQPYFIYWKTKNAFLLLLLFTFGSYVTTCYDGQRYW